MQVGWVSGAISPGPEMPCRMWMILTQKDEEKQEWTESKPQRERCMWPMNNVRNKQKTGREVEVEEKGWVGGVNTCFLEYITKYAILKQASSNGTGSLSAEQRGWFFA